MAKETLIRPLLGPDDPTPTEWVLPDSQSPILLLCEHAGQAVPACLDGLGLPEGAIDLHIGWDPGAERLAKSVASILEAPLILQRYSRLVVDCNRPPNSDGFIPEVSDQIIIPGNQRLAEAERLERQTLIFDPFDRAIAQGFDAAPRRAGFSIHTFTRQMQQGARRACDAGFLSRRDMPAAQIFVDSIGRAQPGLTLAINEPYQVDDIGDWFLPVHAEARGVRHTLIEVCNDQVQTDAQIDRWAQLLANAIRDVLKS